jgi:hypothetical protein
MQLKAVVKGVAMSERHYPRARLDALSDAAFLAQTRNYMAFDFLDETAKQRCYEYLAVNRADPRTLHRAINTNAEPSR